MVPDGTEGVQVNQVIGVMLAEGEDATSLDTPVAEAAPALSAAKPPPTVPAATAEQNSEISVSPLARRMAEQTSLDLSTVTGTGAHGKITRADIQAAASAGAGKGALAAPEKTGRIFASPMARRIATERGIDLSGVTGSGPQGRIVQADLDGAQAAAPIAGASPTSGTGYSTVKLNAMRKAIAERMTLSKQTVPHFYLTVDCQIDELLAERKALNASAEGLKLSINDFIIRAVALALKEVPEANVTWDGDGDGGPTMRQFEDVDVSVAVAIEGGLITPVIRGAQAKGLGQISTEVAELAGRARDGKLAPEDYQGGTFTISNLGMYGIKDFEAIINPPQSGILAVGVGEKRPVVKGGALAIVTVMTMTLSCDHRVVDGAIGARLLTEIKRLLEYPPQMLL